MCEIFVYHIGFYVISYFPQLSIIESSLNELWNELSIQVGLKSYKGAYKTNDK